MGLSRSGCWWSTHMFDRLFDRQNSGQQAVALQVSEKAMICRTCTPGQILMEQPPHTHLLYACMHALASAMVLSVDPVGSAQDPDHWHVLHNITPWGRRQHLVSPEGHAGVVSEVGSCWMCTTFTTSQPQASPSLSVELSDDDAAVPRVLPLQSSSAVVA